MANQTPSPTLTSFKELASLPLAARETPILREKAEDKFIEPVTTDDLNRVLRMLLSEGRKREEMLFAVQKSLREADEELASLRELIESLGGQAVARLQEAGEPPARIQYNLYVVELLRDGIPHTPYDLEPKINQYIKDRGGVHVVTPQQIGGVMGRLVHQGKIARLADNVYKKLETPDEAV